MGRPLELLLALTLVGVALSASPIQHVVVLVLENRCVTQRGRARVDPFCDTI